MTEQSGSSNKEEMRIAFRLARSGEKEQARVILARALQKNPNDPQAWAVMSEVVDTHQQAIDCLYRVLKFSTDLSVVRWATDQLEIHKAALRGTGPLRNPDFFTGEDNDQPPTPPFGTPVLPFASERQPTPPPLSRPDFLHSTGKSSQDVFDTGVEEIFATGVEKKKNEDAADKPPQSKRSTFSFLENDDDPITQTLESPFKQEPLPESDWLEWDDSTIVLDTTAAPDTGKLPPYVPAQEPDTGELPKLEPATDEFDVPKEKPSLASQPVVKSFSTGNAELIPGFETPIVTEAAQPNLSFDFDDDPAQEPVAPEPEKRSGGCLRAVFVVASIVLMAVIVGGFFMMTTGLLPTPAPIAALPFMNVAEPLPEEPITEEAAETEPAVEPVEAPTETPTPAPTPTVTPTIGPLQATTNLPLLSYDATLRATLNDVEEEAAPVNALSNADTGRVALVSRQGVYVFEDGGAPFTLNELGATQVAMSPVDEDLLVSNDGVDVVVWDAGEGQATARLTAHSSPVTALAFSPNGAYLFSGSEDGTIIVWDAADLSQNRIIQRFNPTNRPIQLAGWDGDSSRYILVTPSAERDAALLAIYEVEPEAAEDDATLANDNNQVRVVEVPLDITSIAVSTARPSGTQVAYGNEDGRIQVVNIDTGSVRTLFERPNLSPLADNGNDEDGPLRAVTSLDFSTTGLFAASFGDDTVALWSGETFEPVGAIDQTIDGISEIRWQENGRDLLLVSGADVFVYDFQALQRSPVADPTGIGPGTLAPEPIFELEAAEGALAVTYSTDNRFVSLGLPSNRIIQYSVDDTAETAGTSTLQTQGPLLGSLEDVAFSPNGQLIAAALANGTVVVWSIEAGEVLTTLSGLGDAITEVSFSSSGTQIAAGAIDGDAAIWDIAPRPGLDAPDENLTPIMELRDGHRDVFTAIEWTNDDTIIATSSTDDAVVLWDAANGTIIAKLRGHELGVGTLAINDDNTRLAASVVANGAIFIWDLNTLEQVESLEGHLDIPVALDFRPGSTTLLSAGSNGSGFLWQYESTEYVVLSTDGSNPTVTDAEFAPNANGFTVTFANGTATVYSLNSLE